MIILNRNAKLQLVLAASPAAEAHYYVAYSNSANNSLGVSTGTSNGTTAVDMIDKPGHPITHPTNINIYNPNAAAITATVSILTKGGVSRTLIKISISAGDTLTYANNTWGTAFEGALSGPEGHIHDVDVDNVKVGDGALADLTDGTDNTAIGKNAANRLTEGTYNVAIGSDSMGRGVVFGDYNLGIGAETLQDLTTGDYMVAMGYRSFAENKVGNHSVGIGVFSGEDVTTNYCIYIGSFSGQESTDGPNNIGIGHYACATNGSGQDNIYIGYMAGRYHADDDNNIGIGKYSLYINGGSNNVCVGVRTGQYGCTDECTCVGYQAGNFCDGSYDTLIGSNAGYTLDDGNYNTFIGAYAGYSTVDTNSSLYLGCYAGYNRDTANTLIIDNQDRGSAANEATDSLIYGIFNATPANQTITFNASVFVSQMPSGATAAAAGAGTGELWSTSGHATLPDGVVCIG